MSAIVIDNLILHGPEGRYPIVRVPHSKWIIVGAWGPAWATTDCRTPVGRVPRPWPKGKAVAYDIHFDADDPLHEFLTPEVWAPFPNARKLCAAYNRPHERAFRLRLRRATDASSIREILDPADAASDARLLASQIRRDPSDAHIIYDLEYYPDGHTIRGPQVWKRGQFWFRVTP